MSLRRTQIYVLQEPVTNPAPDGRKRNWTGEKQFPTGRYLVSPTHIRKVGAYRYDSVINDRRAGPKSQYKVLLDALSPAAVAPQSISELLLTLGSEDSADIILGLLLKQGKITAKEIETAAIELDESEDLWASV